MKYLAWGLLILLLLLQYKLWFADGNIAQVYQLRQQLAEQTATNEQLRQNNAVLEAEVYDLKRGTQAIEERARNDMGMIHKDEQFYQLINKKKGEPRS